MARSAALLIFALALFGLSAAVLAMLHVSARRRLRKDPSLHLPVGWQDGDKDARSRDALETLRSPHKRLPLCRRCVPVLRPGEAPQFACRMDARCELNVDEART